MAMNWTEAQIEEVVASVLKNIKGGTVATQNAWDSTQYNGRKLIGVYADMHDAIAAALPLPECYGRNLDALHDVLTEFGASWKIVFRNAGAVARGLRAVCADSVEETPGLEIVFED